MMRSLKKGGNTARDGSQVPMSQTARYRTQTPLSQTVRTGTQVPAQRNSLDEQEHQEGQKDFFSNLEEEWRQHWREVERLQDQIMEKKTKVVQWRHMWKKANWDR